MRNESKKYLYDIARAAQSAMEFIEGKTFSDYAADAMLRSAAERQLEIAGEALAQLARIDPATAAQISEHKRIVSFRNLLINGYAEIDHRIVWSVLEGKLPTLRRQAASLLGSAEEDLARDDGWQ